MTMAGRRIEDVMRVQDDADEVLSGNRGEESNWLYSQRTKRTASLKPLHLPSQLSCGAEAVSSACTRSITPPPCKPAGSWRWIMDVQSTAASYAYSRLARPPRRDASPSGVRNRAYRVLCCLELARESP